MVLNAILLALGGAMIFGLTRQREAWGKWLAIGCFALLLIVLVSGPDDGCSIDWDGRTNPVACD